MGMQDACIVFYRPVLPSLLMLSLSFNGLNSQSSSREEEVKHLNLGMDCEYFLQEVSSL
jgi:hypothetical protein